MESERTTVLPADIDEVRRALLRPELLSAWLGPWTDRGDGTAIVVTDDGVTRLVSGHRSDDDGAVRWNWSPSTAPDDVTRVEVLLEVIDDASTALSVRELRPDLQRSELDPTLSAGEHAATVERWDSSGERWTTCLLALGAVLSARLPVAV